MGGGLLSKAKDDGSELDAAEDEDEEETDDRADNDPEPVITCYKDAIKSLQDIQSFIMTRSDEAELLGLLTKAESVMERKLYQQASTSRQATLDEFFGTS